MKTFTSFNADQTLDLGNRLGQSLTQGVRIAMQGDLGAGKTTFVQGLAKGLGVSEKYYITSPTYNIINEYPTYNKTGNPEKDLILCHLDLYRLESCDELEHIGFDDLLDDKHIIVVEWPELLADISFKFDIEINFKFDDQYNRLISLLASGQHWTDLIGKLAL